MSKQNIGKENNPFHCLPYTGYAAHLHDNTLLPIQPFYKFVFMAQFLVIYQFHLLLSSESTSEFLFQKFESASCHFCEDAFSKHIDGRVELTYTSLITTKWIKKNWSRILAKSTKFIFSIGLRNLNLFLIFLIHAMLL